MLKRLVQAILVNRIQHVAPPRRPFRLGSLMRLALRLPALALLFRAVLLVLSKYAFATPSKGVFPSALRVVLSEDYGQVDDASVMWQCFVSVGTDLYV